VKVSMKTGRLCVGLLAMMVCVDLHAMMEADKFIGAWRLISAEFRAEDGTVEGIARVVNEAPPLDPDAAAALAPSGSTPIPPSRVTTVVTTAAAAAPSRR